MFDIEQAKEKAKEELAKEGISSELTEKDLKRINTTSTVLVLVGLCSILFLLFMGVRGCRSWLSSPSEPSEPWETRPLTIATHAQLAVKRETGNDIRPPNSSDDIIFTQADLYYAVKFTARSGEVVVFQMEFRDDTYEQYSILFLSFDGRTLIDNR
jgi:hypothetical protein